MPYQGLPAFLLWLKSGPRDESVAGGARERGFGQWPRVTEYVCSSCGHFALLASLSAGESDRIPSWGWRAFLRNKKHLPAYLVPIALFAKVSD